MTSTQICRQRRHSHRLTFYDFAIRGEGDRTSIARAIEYWRESGDLPQREAERWHDALEWRELGGLLPGWTVPAWMKEERGEPDETDLRAFDEWRSGRRARAA